MALATGLRCVFNRFIGRIVLQKATRQKGGRKVKEEEGKVNFFLLIYIFVLIGAFSVTLKGNTGISLVVTFHLN